MEEGEKGSTKKGFVMGARREGIPEMDNGGEGRNIKNTFGFLKNRDIKGYAVQGQDHGMVGKRGEGKGKDFELGFDG